VRERTGRYRDASRCVKVGKRNGGKWKKGKSEADLRDPRGGETIKG
jgi:hypothetical protein